jgi:hypothetical protein
MSLILKILSMRRLTDQQQQQQWLVLHSTAASAAVAGGSVATEAPTASADVQAAPNNALQLSLLESLSNASPSTLSAISSELEADNVDDAEKAAATTPTTTMLSATRTNHLSADNDAHDAETGVQEALVAADNHHDGQSLNLQNHNHDSCGSSGSTMMMLRIVVPAAAAGAVLGKGGCVTQSITKVMTKTNTVYTVSSSRSSGGSGSRRSSSHRSC